MLQIRGQDRTRDLQAICDLNAAAFADHGGTAAFDQFREVRDDILSLVATEDEKILGHVLFSPVTLRSDAGTLMGMGLGQLAVWPARQKQGIGSQLAEAGIEQLNSSGCPFIVVIGHAAYYPRFGFERCSLHNITSQWNGIPDETFMIRVLDHNALDVTGGVASFDGL